MIVKRRLYQLLRGTLSQDWLKFLPKVVDSLNHTPIKKLGGLTPNSIHSESDSALVSAARKENNVTVYSEPNFHLQRKNQENYENTKELLQVNDFVYLIKASMFL